MPTIFYRGSRRELRQILRQLPAIIAGRAPDPYGLSVGIKSAVSLVFFSKVKQAFIVKSRGGTDEAGIKWPKLSAAYLAYSRPQSGRKPPRAGGLAPGGKDGFLSEAELAQWRHKFTVVFAMLAARMDPGQARTIAAASAWKELVEEGAKTKIEEFGTRTDVEILRDRGTLLNSLTPGIVTSTGYRKANADQLYEEGLGEVVCGTNTPHGRAHHKGRGVPKRELWPDGARFPISWWGAIIKESGRVIARVVTLIGRAGR